MKGLLLGAAAALVLFPILRAFGMGTGTYFKVMMGLAIVLALWGAFREERDRQDPRDAHDAEEPRR